MKRKSFIQLLVLTILSVTLVSCNEANEEPENDLPVPREVAEEDYIVTESGLKYFDFVEGNGPVVENDAFISVHYHGWFTNDVLFDSSILRNRPFEFFLGRGHVIAGWDEGIQGMRVGGQRQLVIPPGLAYGAAGTPSIPPNATLIFEVELLSL